MGSRRANQDSQRGGARSEGKQRNRLERIARKGYQTNQEKRDDLKEGSHLLGQHGESSEEITQPPEGGKGESQEEKKFQEAWQSQG